MICLDHTYYLTMNYIILFPLGFDTCTYSPTAYNHFHEGNCIHVIDNLLLKD